MSTTTVPYTFEKKGFLIKWVLAGLLGLVIGAFATIFLFYGVIIYYLEHINYIPLLLLCITVWILAENMLTGFGEQLVLKCHL